jgi:hypothetical protein
MANITVTEFRARYAEFRDTTAYPDSVIEMYILDSANEINFDLFGPRAGKAQSVMVAHFLAMADLNAEAAAGGAGSTGAPNRLVASESEGDSSVSYVAQTSQGALDDWFLTTSYGQEWLAMRAVSVPGVTSTGSVQLPHPRGGRRGPFGWVR